MRSCTRHLYPLLVLSLLQLSLWTARGHAEQEGEKDKPIKGFRVERIEQKRTETIAWLRVQVVADTGTKATWSALADIEGWADFLRIFSKITPVRSAGALTLYRMAVRPPWPIRDFDSLIWIAKLPEQHMMFWRSNKDDLTKSHGRIEVKEIPGGTRVSYEMHSPVKRAFAPWVIRIGLYLVLPHIARDFYDRIHEQDSGG